MHWLVEKLAYFIHYSAMCQSGNDAQQALITTLTQKIDKLTAENRELRALVDDLQEKNQLLNQIIFGSSSEQSETINPSQTNGNQNDAVLDQKVEPNATANDDSINPEPDPQQKDGDNNKAYKQRTRGHRGGGRKPLSKRLPRVIHELEPGDTRIACTHCH